MNWLKLKLRVLFTPSCWVQNYPYCATHDRWLLRALATHEFEEVDRFEASIAGKTLWIENHPYASFTPTPLDKDRQARVRPARSTILLAMEKLEKQAARTQTDVHVQ